MAGMRRRGCHLDRQYDDPFFVTAKKIYPFKAYKRQEIIEYDQND